MNLDNYPDDIRSYDHDPRSPFYQEGPECDECGAELSVDEDFDEDRKHIHFWCEACDE